VLEPGVKRLLIKGRVGVRGSPGGTRDRGVAVLLEGLRDRVRLAEGRVAAPSAAVIDSQSVKAAETVARTGRGVRRREADQREEAAHRGGHPGATAVRSGHRRERARPRRRPPIAEPAGQHLPAGTAGLGGRRIYTGALGDWARRSWTITLAIVKRNDDVTGFVVLPRRWVVERTLTWITRHRRCVRDYERLPAHHEAMVRWSMIRITSQRLTKHNNQHR
jgi:hypothetical protein